MKSRNNNIEVRFFRGKKITQKLIQSEEEKPSFISQSLLNNLGKYLTVVF